MTWALAQVTASAKEPVTLEEAKVHLRIDGDAEDAWIHHAISAAREYCEDVSGRSFATRTFRLSLARWPRGRCIRIPRPPLRSITAITYRLADGSTEMLDPGMYVVDSGSEPAMVHLAPDASWPAEDLAPGLAVSIEFEAGYGVSPVPESVKHAILLLLGHWYENREAVALGSASREIEFSVTALLRQQRVWYTSPEVA